MLESVRSLANPLLCCCLPLPPSLLLFPSRPVRKKKRGQKRGGGWKKMPLREGAKEKGGGGGKEPFLFSPVYEFPEEFGKRKEKVKRRGERGQGKKTPQKMTQFCLQNALFSPRFFYHSRKYSSILSGSFISFFLLLLLPVDGDFFPFCLLQPSEDYLWDSFVKVLRRKNIIEKLKHIYSPLSLSFFSSCSFRRIFV